MTLDMSFEQLMNNATYLAAFKADYVNTVAASISLPASSLTIIDIIAGSVIVSSRIVLPANATPAAIDAMVAELKSATILYLYQAKHRLACLPLTRMLVAARLLLPLVQLLEQQAVLLF
jgi:hypothetical protein